MRRSSAAGYVGAAGLLVLRIMAGNICGELFPRNYFTGQDQGSRGSMSSDDPASHRCVLLLFSVGRGPNVVGC